MSLRDLALLTAIKAYAAGKRWRVVCHHPTCGTKILAVDVNELGRALLTHGHGGDVSICIATVKG